MFRPSAPLVLVLATCLVAPAQNQQPAPAATTPPVTASAPVQLAANLPAKLILQDGTPVHLRLQQTVTSAEAHVGQTVDFDVLDEVKLGDLVVVPKGSIAWATVTEAEHKKRMGRGGKLNMNIDTVRLEDGEKAALRAVKGGNGGGHVGAMTGAIVATSLVLWPAAPFFLFMHGKDITIPKGTEITAYVNGDFNIETAKFRPAPPVVAPVQVPAAPAQVQTALSIGSNPPGAEITLDGNFVGNTPSTVQVSEGDHTVSLKKSGFKLWERKIKTSGGSVKVEPDLEAVEQ